MKGLKMTETMLERAAKAAWLDLRILATGWNNKAEREAYEQESGFVVDTWPETHMSVDADAFRSAARAALEAIREPDEAMTDAGQQNPSIEGRPLWKCTTDVQCSVRFTAMIDAILSQSQEGGHP